MAYLLRAFGHETLEACDGAEGVGQASREKPDLILMDIHMPRMDGYELARILNEKSDGARIPIVAVTALAMVGDRDKILASGFSGYISKPIDPEKFAAQVNGYLGVVSQVSPQPAVKWEQPEAPEKTAPDRNGFVVVVVDDQQANIDLLRGVLEPSGYEVVAALSAEAGFALAQRTRADLVISEVHMLLNDGHDFLLMMQTVPEMSGIPFVFLSSSVLSSQERDRAAALGAKKFISRPIDPQDLLDELRPLLPKRADARSRGGPKAAGVQE